ncbi:MAG: hypothetical protein J6T10_18855 [Methanobrevibacter sp.]|nr:hypothetical protein [Methanobrevibacter sp.]
MHNYLFWDEVTGEEFLVYAQNKKQAIEIANEYFEEPQFDSEVTDFEAEMMGLDTY